MPQPVSHPTAPLRSVLRRLALIAALCLVVSGCKSWNLRGEEFTDNSLSDFCGQCRQSDDTLETWAFSNKAQQIERNLGAR